MALGWVVVLLSFLGCSVAQENLQASSQRCVEDTNTFLWEINQDRPKEYAVLSKSCWLLKGFFWMYGDLWVESLEHLHWGCTEVQTILHYRGQNGGSRSFRGANDIKF